MHPILIKNADVYAPEHLGTRDIFLAGGKIVAMAEKLDVTLPDLEVIDAAGYIVAPGLVDQHIHITGGGGEGGWHSRCPELVFSELVKAGVTTFLGVSGTDSMTRSVENLLAKVRGLKNEGASGWMWTSNYAYPVTTITKDVRTDMLAIPEVLGVKIALGDHRSSFPNQHEIMQILADVRVSGMLTGKTGFLHVHLGDFPYSFDIFDECVAQGMPIKHIRPTHVARHPEVFRRACEFAKKGGFIDITTGGGNYMGSAADAVRAALADGVPFDRITLSSDGHGSMPCFNEAGEMVGLGIGSIMCDIETIRELKDELGVEKALTPMTKTVAGALGLETKGGIAVGKDADLLFLTKDFEPEWVFMMGKVAMRQGEVVMKGAFEE
jgi:beta-aspartyl-dipeptidase (metallo-type)